MNAAKLKATKLQKANISQFGWMAPYRSGARPLVRSTERRSEPSVPILVSEDGLVMIGWPLLG